ncbi:ParB/RepB/Spo0J family partition protein [Amycolatopsis australiensis]|uniref:ParB/RepB/Spo0J family partition protein n=1 Tax=Amycolatopsis australiensis TaxID=546364 RepID=A0A1K1LPY7_9PSEU|nr:hypothetical protein [Amycolatopsis australiensis]SFW12953.1 ParB/RepB/Spo0J family partition protein [Amycolatopsis australiensis]
MPKNFAAMDVHAKEADPLKAFHRRYDESRTSLFEVSLNEAFPNPINPRYANDPEVVETAGSLREVGQLQPIVVVTRDAFVEAYPELDGGEGGVPVEIRPELNDGKVGRPVKIKYVIVIGNRRHAGAALNKWQTLEAVLAPSVATAAEIEDRILHENIHRQGLPPLLEAAMLQNKMKREGLSLRDVAKKIHKTHAYVDSRIDLLKLIPEFQGVLQREFPLPASERTLKLKLARAIAKLPRNRQKEIWDAGVPYQVDPVIPDYTSAPSPAAAGPAAPAPAVSPDRQSPAAAVAHPDSSEEAAAVIPDYSSAAATTSDADSGGEAPAVSRDYSRGAEQASGSASAPPARSSVPEPDGTSTAASPSQPWPLVVEAEDVSSLAVLLVDRLSPDERVELAHLLQPSS